MKDRILNIVENFEKDPGRMMDILLEVQSEFGCVSHEAVSIIASALNVSEVDVTQTRSFYHFFTCQPVGKYAVYVNNSVVSCMKGMSEVVDEFEKVTGIKFGSKTQDGLISLHYTACIGMSDQEPAALINSVVFTELNREKVRKLVADMRAGKAVQEMFTELGDGINAHPLVKSMVKNNIRKAGPVTLGEYTVGKGLMKALGMDSKAVITEVKDSNLRGRGGAGFPTGMKWDFCSRESGDHYVLCNADEGEPGTFKDRVLLTERAHMLFEGMAIAGYAIGAKEGILYLRNEYAYLKAYMESVLTELRNKNILGKNIHGKGFDFDIRVQYGAGAYVCGEESALIESAEGKRGEPRNRPPFPVQKGYKNKPTIINNVETFCSAVKIIENGSAWYKAIGTPESAGTKLLSISGDCKLPGVYEIVWGMSIKEMLDMVGAENVQAVQVAGPSGICLPPSQFDRKIALEDLPTGGSMIVIGKNRDLLKDVVLNFMEFFADESCGSCVTCRSFNMILKNSIEKIVEGHGIKKNIDEMMAWSEILRKTTRCGLGQTSSNPITTTIKNFKELYDMRVKDVEYQSEFDMSKAVKDSCEVVGRPAIIHE
ncbi:MAG: NAD(P)H-dependent oxidoreductase subunit E [Bacteroidales bacterium]|nr:NAD(P)H-dependent oxidoreductase subunit E [Bacteroidales bacterium]